MSELVGASIAVASGVLLLLVEQGGRSGRARRRIREELELAALLQSAGAAVPAQRLRAFAAKRSEEYPPKLGRPEWIAPIAVIVVLSSAYVIASPGLSFWPSVAVGVTIGSLAAGLNAWIEIRRAAGVDLVAVFEEGLDD